MADKSKDTANNSYTEELLKELARKEADKKAITEEFAEEIKTKGKLFDEEDIKAKIKEVLPDAFAALKSLLNGAESESVRASLVKYVFDAALLSLRANKPEDEEVPETVGDLIKQLKGNDNK